MDNEFRIVKGHQRTGTVELILLHLKINAIFNLAF